jgi:hypothetical protein
MKTAFLILTMLAMAAHSASARIGETLEQCIARYGQPVLPLKEGGPAIFVKSNVAICVTFYQGRADMLVFWKRNDTGQKGPLSDGEVSLLMNANAGGHSWQKADNGGSTISAWKTDDGKILAALVSPDRSLTISTMDALARQHAAGASAPKALTGF